MSKKKDVSITGRFFGKILIITFVFVIAFAFFGGLGWYTGKRFEESKFEALNRMVSAELIECAELTVVKSNYSDIVTLKKKEVLGLAKSYTIISYNAVARVGIGNIEKTTFTISQDRKSITAILPKVQVLGNEIARMELFDEFKNAFAPITQQEIFDEINKSKDIALENLLAEGIIEEAEKRAEQIVKRIFSAMGFEEIQISFQNL